MSGGGGGGVAMKYGVDEGIYSWRVARAVCGGDAAIQSIIQCLLQGFTGVYVLHSGSSRLVHSVCLLKVCINYLQLAYPLRQTNT